MPDERIKQKRLIALEDRDAKARLWLKENADAIRQNNAYFAEHGLPFAEYRGSFGEES